MRILTVVLSIQGADGRPGELLAGGGDGHLSESDANRVSMGRDAGVEGYRSGCNRGCQASGEVEGQGFNVLLIA